MKIKFLILVTIFLVSSMLSTDAFSMAHDKLLKDLNKAAEQLNKDLDSNKIKENSKTSNNLNKNPDNLNNSKLEKKSSPVVQGKLDSEADNKFFRKAYYCPPSSGYQWHFIYNTKENKKPELHQRCQNTQKNYKELKDLKSEQVLKGCYGIHKSTKSNRPPELGFWKKDKKTNKQVCSVSYDKFWGSDSFLNFGSINLDMKTGLFDIREILDQLKDKKDEESKALLSKLKFIFGLTSENQYEVAVASAQKEEDRVRQEETKIAQKNLDEEIKKKNLERASKQIPFKKKMNLQCLIIVNNTPQVYQYQLDGSTVWFKGAKFELGVAQFDSILRDNELLITRENNIVKYKQRTLKTGTMLEIEMIKSIEILVDIRTLKAEMIINDNQKFLGNCSVI